MVLALVVSVAGFTGLVRDSQDGLLAPPPAAVTGDPGSVAGLQARLRRVPDDYIAWASLGLAYLDQARMTGDPSLYPRAQGALEKSLAINTEDNDAAAAGMSALSNGRHQFAEAGDWARRGLAINPASAVLHGALSDALIQQGRYSEGFEEIQRMVDLRPDTASLARASYAWELRGDVSQATALMQRALSGASSRAEQAFARQHLGDLAFGSGDPAGALVHHDLGLAADDSAAGLMSGRARALAALGRMDEAVVAYTQVVTRSPQPHLLIEFGELLESLGRSEEAEQQYQALSVVLEVLAVNGAAADVEPTLFVADHGDPARALDQAAAGIARRGFMDMADAHAWALHVNGRNSEALEWSNRAMALGTRRPLFHYHAGMIHLAMGNTEAAARELEAALSINPHFNFLAAPKARATLNALKAQEPGVRG